MLNRLIGVLRCPACFGRYRFQEVGTEEIFRPSGILTCSKCGKSVITIKGIPIFHTLFYEPSRALKVLSLIFCDDSSTDPLLASLLGRTKEPVRLRELLNYLDNENLPIIFERFRTGYINLERFAWKKFWGAQKFLTRKPLGTLLDIGCGFGCSTNPFLTGEKVRYCIGLDRSLFFLFLFRRYCRERGFQNVDLVCFDASNQPFPFKRASFDLVTAISFFNHFASTRDRRKINIFFRELDRITTDEGRVYVDAVPNRLNPFQGEVNLSPIILRGSLGRVAEIIACTIPTKWMPRSLSMNLLWHTYRSYCKLTNIEIEPFEVFLRYVSSVIPEIDVNCLPILPSAFKGFFTKSTETKVIPQSSFYEDFTERKWTMRDFFRSTYLILYASKHKNRGF